MLYAITDRRLYGTAEDTRRQRLLAQTAVWAANGVSFIQLREKDLSARDQVELARTMLQILRPAPTRLLISSRPDVALAAGADGVHLPAGPDALTPDEVRAVFAQVNNLSPYISVSCHTLAEVSIAREQKADAILFAPVFEKVLVPDASDHSAHPTLPGVGLHQLREACRAAAPIPVFALGGVTAANASLCLDAGAAGIAAIRLMQEPASVWRNLA